MSKRSRSPWLWPAFIFDRLPIGRDQKKALKVLHGFTRQVQLLLFMKYNCYFVLFDSGH